MGLLSRFHRVPPFLVGSICGGGVYVFYHQQLQTKYHPIPRTIWNVMYASKEDRTSLTGTDGDEYTSGPTTPTELNEVALNVRKNREYYRDCFVIGWNDSVRTLHAFLIRHIFGEELK
mmetsp:Transcript_13141/g.19883  ORF Transcript_13141/g.19883 Transcript_13141/m.19883 type:complete len:118 (+) Transcript_13141:20-373(+)